MTCGGRYEYDNIKVVDSYGRVIRLLNQISK